MTANPKSSELAVSLARYLVARGRVDDAKAVYATALKIVQAAGNKTLEAAISQEAASL
jgi:thioredoxin-like negative regulator of GroEL